ncbi:MAG: enoyl-ACP reductase FabI [Alphaproteobacteria bacterium]|nr:enoyl-ACP reductase FabI [Alphaproteobacteria bacterium]
MDLATSLRGRKGLVIGIANEQSIATGCARAFRAAGAELAVTYLNDKAEPHVRPIAEALEAPLCLPLDMREPGQLDAVFGAVERLWGGLDFVLHSIAYCPKADLQARLTDCSREGFLEAMDVSVHSFLRVARLAEPLMSQGPFAARSGALLTMSYYGAEKVVEHYNVMGPVKAALEACVRYMAAELGPRNIRVHALSPGPIATRAASGIAHFDALMERARRESPEGRLVTIEEVGAVAAFLASEAASGMTGTVTYVDAGVNIVD